MRYLSASATYSPDERYRYVLSRRWAREGEDLVVIGLNPSTATETQDDPTIRRCVSLAQREGFAGLVMLNLFAYRSTAPAGMKTMGSAAVGRLTAMVIGTECVGRPVVVAAWGKHGTFRDRDLEVERLLQLRCGVSMVCLGRNGDGTPKHPLYLANDTKLTPYTSRLQ